MQCAYLIKRSIVACSKVDQLRKVDFVSFISRQKLKKIMLCHSKHKTRIPEETETTVEKLLLFILQLQPFLSSFSKH